MISNMVAYVLFRCLEQIRHHLLSEPDGFILKTDINFYSAVFGLINQKLALLWKILHVFILLLSADFSLRPQASQNKLIHS